MASRARSGAKAGQVVLRGRFRPGSRVRLVEVAGEHVLRSQGGRLLDVKRVDDDGCVKFTHGVVVGGRYILVGQVGGQPLEVRARGGEPGADAGSQLAQEPVRRDRVRLANGAWADEAPEREKPGAATVAPGPAQHQVPEGTVQRSDTPLGAATPVDPDETLPYPKQEDVEDGVFQMSDTKTGMATPIVDGPPRRQEDADDGKLLQRSDTPHGVTTPIPAGSSVDAKRERDSSARKGTHGEPTKVAAAPVEVSGSGSSRGSGRRPAKSKGKG